MLCLNQIISFLEQALEDPYEWPPLVTPAIPVDESYVPPEGDSALRPPGSPAETFPRDADVTVYARRALDTARRLLHAVENDSEKITRQLVGEAIAFGALLPDILEWYDGRAERKFELFSASQEFAALKKKTSESQAAKGERNSKLTDEEWIKVSKFIREQFDQGISISRACKNASKRLLTGEFRAINKSIEISASALNKRLKPNKGPMS